PRAVLQVAGNVLHRFEAAPNSLITPISLASGFRFRFCGLPLSLSPLLPFGFSFFLFPFLSFCFSLSPQPSALSPLFCSLFPVPCSLFFGLLPLLSLFLRKRPQVLHGL